MRTRVFFFAAAILSALVLYPLAVPLCLGAILGFLSENTVETVARRMKNQTAERRLVVSSAFVAIVTLVVLVPLISSLAVSAFDLTALLSNPDFSAAFSSEKILVLRDRLFSWMSGTLLGYGIDFSISDIGHRLEGAVSSIATQTATFLGKRLAATPWFIFEILLAILSWVVFAANGKQLREKTLPFIIPWNRERIILCETVGRVIRSLFVANASIAAIQCLTVTIILGLTSIPRFLMFGLLSFFLSFVPLLGTGLVLVPSAVYLASEGRWIAATLVGGSSIAVGLVDNLLRPMLMRDGLPFGFFWIFLSIIGGITQFGLAGTLIGPIAFSLFVASRNLLSTDENSERPIS